MCYQLQEDIHVNARTSEHLHLNLISPSVHRGKAPHTHYNKMTLRDCVPGRGSASRPCAALWSLQSAVQWQASPNSLSTTDTSTYNSSMHTHSDSSNIVSLCTYEHKQPERESMWLNKVQKWQMVSFNVLERM